MMFHPERYHRRSIRLKGYDYRQAGAYFVTICTQDRAFLFGQVVHDEMQLNDAGKMVYDVWNDLPAFTLACKPTHSSLCPTIFTASSSS